MDGRELTGKQERERRETTCEKGPRPDPNLRFGKGVAGQDRARAGGTCECGTEAAVRPIKQRGPLAGPR